MADIPPPLSAKEFFTPEFLRDPYPTYRRYLDGPGFSFLLFMEEFGPPSSMQIARHFFGTPNSPLSVLAL
jgi:hypothetical protein